ncbi:MAG: DUF4262 domain-containing protein [Parasphingopyxis sp.]|uniref:DUF4262 domain-containing protein n=1 Tax=Parasphingopyxis sp. TaxID=1920299 RepID=UPI003FA17359
MMGWRKLDSAEQKVVADIHEHGCHVMHVFDEHGTYPDFSYSIGFPETVSQPEVIVFGLKPELMHYMINDVHRQCSNGLELQDGIEVGDLVEDHDCKLRFVHDKASIREHFSFAIWYHRSQRKERMTEAYQIVWPGAKQGLFPWEEGCDTDVIDAQPALYAVGDAA